MTRSPFHELLGLPARVHHPDGSVSLDLAVGPAHQNEGGIVHGGVYVALLDDVLGGAVTRTLAEGEWTATQSLTTDFLRPASEGTIRATGRVERRGALSAFVAGEVRSVPTGELLARAIGVWAIRRG